MFRIRVSGSPVSINIWRGSASTYSYQASDTPIQSGNWFYVINCDDSEWIAIPISQVSTLAESSFAFTNSIDLTTVRTNAEGLTQVTAWVDALDLKRVIIAVSDQATYDPFATAPDPTPTPSGVTWSGTAYKAATNFYAPVYDTALPTHWIVGGGEAYLARATLDGNNYSYLRINSTGVLELRTTDTLGDEGASAGPQFTDEIESGMTITFQHATAGTLTVDGPGSSDVQFTDTNEPYTWFYDLSGAKTTEILAWFGGVSDQDQVTVTISPPMIDNLVLETEDSIDLGSPTLGVPDISIFLVPDNLVLQTPSVSLGLPSLDDVNITILDVEDIILQTEDSITLGLPSLDDVSISIEGLDDVVLQTGDITLGSPSLDDVTITILDVDNVVIQTEDSITLGSPSLDDVTITILQAGASIQLHIGDITLGSPSLDDVTIRIVQVSNNIRLEAEDDISLGISSISNPNANVLLIGSEIAKFLLARMLDYIPVEYRDSTHFLNILKPIINKLIPAYLYLITQSSQSDAELETYKNNIIGYGWERFINQSAIITMNDHFENYGEVYDISLHDVESEDYDESIVNRNRLLLYAKQNLPSNLETLRSEMSIISDSYSIREDVDNFRLILNITTEDEHDKQLLLNRLSIIKPLHLQGQLIDVFSTIRDGLTIRDGESIGGGLNIIEF